MTARNLLVELRVEELPPKTLKKLGTAFGQGLANALKAQGLATETSVLTTYATPRRLAAHISHVLAAAPEMPVSHKLMPVTVALNAEGRPTPALVKKLATLGVGDVGADVLQRLARRQDGKSETLFLDVVQPGARLAAGLQKALDETLAALPIAKVMQYQLADGWTSVNFVRPAHGLVALHGAEVVPVSVLGLEAGRRTEGHRFEAAMNPVVLQDADHYARQLDEQGGVIASFEARRAELLRQLHAAASREGLKAIEDEALLDEVTALVEKPNVLTCRFEREFLAVPQECLILTMKANQKYFPLLDAEGRLTERFLVVSNIRPADASRVVQGNERVVRPRLADAKFFFDQDRKKTLLSRLPGLDKVVYHAKLGSMGERMQRVRSIAREIGERLSASLGGPSAAALAEQAASLAKADLLTDMVGEFPELQGVMGGYYARHDGVPEAVAEAIEDHYKPRFAGDMLPRGNVGLAVALADKLETLVGLFQEGEVPTGDKDPFALRRHAIGVLRCCMERALPFSLGELVALVGQAWDQAQAAIDGRRRMLEAMVPGVTVYQSGPLMIEILNQQLDNRRVARDKLLGFMLDRLSGYLRELGYTAHQVDAVLAIQPQSLAETPRRLEAVRAFAAMPESASLAAANKRVANILKKSEGAAAQGAVDPARLVEPAERALHEALARVAPVADRAFEAGDLTGSLRELATLKTAVDAFFDQVMVNAEDAALRTNRLALLAALHRAMNRVADLARLAA